MSNSTSDVMSPLTEEDEEGDSIGTFIKNQVGFAMEHSKPEGYDDPKIEAWISRLVQE